MSPEMSPVIPILHPDCGLLSMRKLCSLVFIALSTQALATEPPQYDRIMFTVTAQAEVPQEKLTATLFAQEEGRDAARLADGVNQRVALALDLAKNEPGISTRTLGYNSYPFYKNQRVEGWVVKQSIEIESDNALQFGQLIGKLQSDLHVQSIDYIVTPKVLAETTEKLTEKAMASFQARAERISKAWGRSGYRLVQMAIQDQGQHPQPMAFAMNRGASLAAAPTLEPGKQTLSVSLTGTIELAPPAATEQPTQ